MTLSSLLQDKAIKSKEKTETISQWLLECSLAVDEYLALVPGLKKEADRATCIEAMEFASRQRPSIADEEVLAYVSQTLTEKAPRIKWESAKVIGNIAHLFPDQLDKAVAHLLVNAVHEGTVVRWSAAFALGEILKCKTALNTRLIPSVETLCAKEEKNSIKKIYLAGLKKCGKT